MPERLGFGKSLFKHWRSLMTGLVSVILGGLQYVAVQFSWWPNKDFWNKFPGPVGWVVIGVAFLFWAAFSTWRDERSEVLRMDELVRSLREALDNKRPQLKGSIEQTILGEITPGNVVAHVNMTIFNTGEPSLAHNYSMGVVINGKYHAGNLETIVDPTILQVNSGQVTLSSRDAIYEKSVQPIAKNGMARGWIRCSVPGIGMQLAGATGSEWRVSFTDILGVKSETNHVFGSHPMEFPQYFPDGSKSR